MNEPTESKDELDQLRDLQKQAEEYSLEKKRWTLSEILEGVRVWSAIKALRPFSMGFKENRLLRWLVREARKRRIPATESDHLRIEAAEAKRQRKADKRKWTRD